MSSSGAGRPRPQLTQETEFYWRAAREHRLAIQQCAGCQRLRHPPTPCCPHCLSLDWGEYTAAGTGSLFTYTVVHRPVTPPFQAPYAVGVVELDEGPRVVAEIVDVDRDDLRIGLRLAVDFLDLEQDLTLPVFRPARGAGH